MNTRLAGHIAYVTNLFFVFVFMFLFTACTETLSGVVCIDQNKNNSCDMDEAGISYATMNVTRDGKTIAMKRTDAKGRYSVHLKRRSGQLCLLPDFSTAKDLLEKESEGKALIKAITVDSKSSVINNSFLPESGTGTKTGTETQEKTKPTTETTNTTPKTPEGWIDGKYCLNQTKSQEIDIPAKIDVEGVLPQLPKRLTITCFSGDECDLNIVYPKGCLPEMLCLMADLIPTPSKQKGLTFDSSLNCVSFEEDTESDSKSEKAITTSTVPSIAVSGFEVKKIKLMVKEDAAPAKETLQPTADCDGDQMELHDIPIEIKRDLSATVYQGITPITDLHENSSVVFKVQVANKGKSPLINGELTFTIPEEAEFTPNTPCNKFGTKAICNVDFINAGETHPAISFGVRLPPLHDAKKNDSVGLSTKAKFTADGLENPALADDLSFKVIKTQDG